MIEDILSNSFDNINFMGYNTICGECPECRGIILVFKEKEYYTAYCCNCRTEGTFNPGGKINRRGELHKKRQNLIEKAGYLFNEGPVDAQALPPVMGFSQFKHDPLTKAFGKSIGYIPHYKEFKDEFMGGYSPRTVKITEGIHMYTNLLNKPALVLPLSRHPGKMDGYTVIQKKLKMSRSLVQKKNTPIYSFLQVNPFGETLIFNDIIEDLPEIKYRLMFDSDSTIAVKPAVHYKV